MKYENENEFLETLLNRQVWIYLVNGIKLQGQLTQIFDSGDVLLSRGNETQLIRLNGQGTVFPINEK